MKEQLLEIAKKSEATTIINKIEGLQKNNYKTTVAFLGEFSSGKTTLINALIKKQFLPSFDKPTTAIVTEILRGPETSFNIIDNINGEIETKEIEVSEIAEEVQKEGDKRLLKVELNDSDLINENTILIDTPGVSSINQLHSSVTYGYLPNMDVVFMVVNINMGSISKSLEAFIKDCPKNVLDKLFFVLNFKDTKAPSQIHKLVSEFENSIEQFIPNARVLVVSAKLAIKANNENNNELFLKSGVNEIEDIIKLEIPKLHVAIAEDRYLEALTTYKDDLIFFLQEKESNLSLDKTEFLNKIENLKLEKETLINEKNNLFRDLSKLKDDTESSVKNLNKEYTSLFINALNNNALPPILEQYSIDFSAILEKKLNSIENYSLPVNILDKLSGTTANSINSKVGNIFQIANKLPGLINAGAIALATGGTSVVANVAEMAIVHTAGKALELNERYIEDQKTKEEVKQLVEDGQNTVLSTLPNTTELPRKPISKTRKVTGTIINILNQLNVTEFAKNKITEMTQQANVYRALKNSSDNIVDSVFSGVEFIITNKISEEIDKPIKLKEESLESVRNELSESSENLKVQKNQIAQDLLELYKIEK